MKLSPNFALDEFLLSQTAARRDIDMEPPTSVIDNLKSLCETILQPIRDDLGVPIFVSSGYRPKELNRLVGGSDRSQHPRGEAADITASGMTPAELFKRIEALDLPVHQCILEFGCWVHVSKKPDGRNPNRQYLTAVREDGRTVYKPGLVA